MKSKPIKELMRQAQLLLNQRELPEARTLYRRICQLEQTNAQAWVTLGNLCGALGDPKEAEACCRTAIQLNPTLTPAYTNLGTALLVQGHTADAASAYRKATELQPELTAAWFMYAKASEKLGLWPESVAAYKQVLQLQPDHPEARLYMGNALQFLGRHQEAATQYQQLVDANPRHAEAHYRLAVALSGMGRTHEAEASCRKSLHIRPDHVEALNCMGMILTAHGQAEKALSCCSRALEINPENINAASLAANIHEQCGDADKGYEYLAPLIETGIVHINLALSFAAICKELGREKQAITMMEELLNHKAQLTSTSRRNLHFTLGKLYDSMGAYDLAFKHYQSGNELKQLHFDRQRFRRAIENTISVQNRDFMQQAPRATLQSDKPVFIVGMPRSGTSLVEQILASHPLVYGAGEMPDIEQLVHSMPEILVSKPRYPQLLTSATPKVLNECAERYLKKLENIAPRAKRVTDKTPGNFMYLGAIELMFPSAKIIHCNRDPLDSCLSCYFQDFAQGLPWAYDFKSLAAYHQGYEHIMDHWKQVLKIPVLDVHYEDLVVHQEKISHQILDFCSLNWDERCLHFHRTKRFVATASYDQVRQPIYRKSIARWKNYAEHIEPLIRGLTSTTS